MASTTRRNFLRWALLGSAATLAAACSSPAPPAPTSGQPSAPTISAAGGAATGAPVATVAPGGAAAAGGGTLNFAMDTDADVLDPNYSPQRPSQIVFFSLYDCLIARAKDNSFQPWLATSWQVSPDGKSYTFKLRTDVRFHDGTPFNAQAVKFNFDRAHDEKFASRMIGSGGAEGFYASTDAIDDSTVRINLNRPWAPFLDAISYLYRLVSPAAVQKYGDDFGRNPVGSGPFKFVEWVANDHITIERNPNYHWPAPVYKNQGIAQLERVVFKVIPEAGTRTAVLEKGEADVAMTLPPQDALRLQSDPHYQMLVGHTPGIPFLFTANITKAPTDDLAVRQAMNYGVDRDAICNIVFGPYQALGANTPARGMLVPGTFGYDKNTEIYTYDADKARSLLDNAGWRPGGDGIRVKDGQPLQVLLGTWETQSVADVAQAQLRDVGLDLKVQVSPPLTVNENQRKGLSNMSPLPAARSDPSVISNDIHSRNIGSFGFTFQRDPALDALLDQADSEMDQTKRLQLVSEAQLKIMQAAMVFPLYNRDNIVVASKKVDGLEFERGFFPWITDVALRSA